MLCLNASVGLLGFHLGAARGTCVRIASANTSCSHAKLTATVPPCVDLPCEDAALHTLLARRTCVRVDTCGSLAVLAGLIQPDIRSPLPIDSTTKRQMAATAGRNQTYGTSSSRCHPGSSAKKHRIPSELLQAERRAIFLRSINNDTCSPLTVYLLPPITILLCTVLLLLHLDSPTRNQHAFPSTAA